MSEGGLTLADASDRTATRASEPPSREPAPGVGVSAPAAAPEPATAVPDPLRAAQPTQIGRLSVRLRLVILLLLVTIPVIAVALHNALNRHDSDLEASRRVVGLFAEVIMREQSTVLATTRQMLQVLAGGIDRSMINEPAACREIARRVAGLGSYFGGFFVVDADGRMTCSTTGGRSGGAFTDSKLFRSLKDTRQFSASLALVGPLTGQPTLVLGLPLMDGDRFAGAVGATILLSHFANLPGYGRMPPGTAVWVMGRDGSPLVNIVGGDALLPNPLSKVITVGNQQLVFDDETPSGEPGFYALRPLTGDIVLLVGAPAAQTIRQADADFALRIAQIMLLVGLSVLVVTLGAYYAVLKPLRSLGHAIGSYGGAEVPFTPPRDLASMPTELRRLAKRFIEVTDTVSDREKRLKELVAQRDLLVREIHHRVKNNLQIVSSLLNLQAQRIRHPAARGALYTARERVAALSLLHRHLYAQQEAQAIDFRAFLVELVAQMSGLMDGQEREHVRIEVDAPTIRLASDQVVPLGLVVTEVITNAFKHGFPDGRPGTIQVQMKILPDGQAELVIRDDGVHADPPVDDESGGLGSVLITGFGQQLGGTIETSSPDGGFALKLTFPIQPVD